MADLMHECLGFKTKTAITNYIRGIVAKYRDGEELDPFDHGFMRRVFEHHRRAAEKFGCGVRSIIVQTNRAPGQKATRGFWLIREDGSATDISWVECVSPSPKLQQVLAALRALVTDQIESFRRQYPPEARFKCPSTGMLCLARDMEVDHAPPMTFRVLVNGWSIHAGPLEEIELQPIRDADTIERLADPRVAESWQDFHRIGATFRFITPLGNKRQNRKGGDNQ